MDDKLAVVGATRPAICLVSNVKREIIDVCVRSLCPSHKSLIMKPVCGFFFFFFLNLISFPGSGFLQ